MKASIDYILGLISNDFCHRNLLSTPQESCIRDFYAYDDECVIVRGFQAMSALARQAYEHGNTIFDAQFMSDVSANELRPFFMCFDRECIPMEIPLLAERVRVMNEVGRILLEKWNGSFSTIVTAANSRAYHRGGGLVEIFVKDFPRFKAEI